MSPSGGVLFAVLLCLCWSRVLTYHEGSVLARAGSRVTATNTDGEETHRLTDDNVETCETSHRRRGMDRPAYWIIDLGESFIVDEVFVFIPPPPLTNMGAPRGFPEYADVLLTNIEVNVAKNQNLSDADLCGQFDPSNMDRRNIGGMRRQGFPSGPEPLQCRDLADQDYRYVIIQATVLTPADQQQHLTLCEVDVVGRDPVPRFSDRTTPNVGTVTPQPSAAQPPHRASPGHNPHTNTPPAHTPPSLPPPTHSGATQEDTTTTTTTTGTTTATGAAPETSSYVQQWKESMERELNVWKWIGIGASSLLLLNSLAVVMLSYLLCRGRRSDTSRRHHADTTRRTGGGMKAPLSRMSSGSSQMTLISEMAHPCFSDINDKLKYEKPCREMHEQNQVYAELNPSHYYAGLRSIIASTEEHEYTKDEQATQNNEIDENRIELEGTYDMKKESDTDSAAGGCKPLPDIPSTSASPGDASSHKPRDEGTEVMGDSNGEEGMSKTVVGKRNTYVEEPTAGGGRAGGEIGGDAGGGDGYLEPVVPQHRPLRRSDTTYGAPQPHDYLKILQ